MDLNWLLEGIWLLSEYENMVENEEKKEEIKVVREALNELYFVI